MVICFECTQDTKLQLDELLASGHYKDYSEAIAVAIANQSLLHEKVGPTGSVVATENSGVVNSTTPSTRATRKIVAVNYTTKKIIEPAIPHVFRKNGKPPAHEAAPMPEDSWAEGIGAPVEKWIFGQYNKLFPVKASCRALANILVSEHANFTSNPGLLAQQIAMHAVELGRYLLHYDLQHSIARDIRLSIAFPTPDPLSEKSRERYANQFVISVNRAGQISSLLVEYKFLNFTHEKRPRLLLTEPGWHFAQLANPVLDGKDRDTLERFSDKEKEFLIEHIFRYIPLERIAYRTILSAITKGENTPDKLGSALDAYVRDKNAYTLSFLAAQRSGAVSRMADLELLMRSRDGVRVTYQVTKAGHAFLKRAAITSK